MAVDTLNPNSDDAPNAWSLIIPVGAHFETIDEGAVPDITNSIGALQGSGDDNDEEEFGFPDTITGVDEVTQVVVSIYGTKVGNSPEVDVNLGGYIGAVNCGLPEAPAAGWVHKTFAGLSGSQADLDALQVKLIANVPNSKDTNTVHTMYVTITYSEAAAGYGHDFMGVPAANIGNVCGVPAANIDKIKGV